MKLSIVIPVKNQRERIARCLGRLMNQTVMSEIIIVDGGSTDGTLDVINLYKSIITLVHETGNKSPANARNIGMENATGDLVIFLDTDALLSNDYTEIIQKEFIEHPNVDTIRFKWKPEYPEFKCLVEKLMFYKDMARKHKWIHQVYKKHVLPRFKNIGFGEDRIWGKEIRAKNLNIYYSDKTIGESQFYCEDMNELIKRYKWYGRTMIPYIKESKDLPLAIKFGFVIECIPFIFLLLVPFIRGLYLGLKMFHKCRQAPLLAFLEPIAWLAMWYGFWTSIFKRKKEMGR